MRCRAGFGPQALKFDMFDSFMLNVIAKSITRVADVCTVALWFGDTARVKTINTIKGSKHNVGK